MVSGRAAALLEENIMNPTVCTHKNNPNFWIFGLFFFLYFFICSFQICLIGSIKKSDEKFYP